MKATRERLPDQLYTDMVGPKRLILAIGMRTYTLACGHTVPKVKHRSAKERQIGDEFRCSGCKAAER